MGIYAENLQEGLGLWLVQHIPILGAHKSSVEAQGCNLSTRDVEEVTANLSYIVNSRLGFKSKTKQNKPPRTPGEVGSWEESSGCQRHITGTWC